MKKYRLDNAALIFPSILSERETTLSRISITLTEKVAPEILQEALKNIIPRFPYFQVYLKFGFRWPVFHHTPDIPEALPDHYPPCSRIQKRGFLFNVWYGEKSIAVEFSHILSDAKGTLIFLNSLVYEYCRLAGLLKGGKTGQNPFFPETEEEAEQDCAYRRHFKKMANPPAFSRSYHMPDPLMAPGEYHTTTLSLDAAQVIALVKEHKTTVNTLFAAFFCMALAELYGETGAGREEIIRLEIPINMRQFYETDTLRNFSLFLAPSIKTSQAKLAFSEILTILSGHMQEQIESKYLEKQISRNVGSELNWFISGIPMVLKHVILKIVYKRLGETQFSGFLTNLGNIEISEDLKPFIERFGVVPAPSPVTKTNIAIHSFNGVLQITFGSVIESPALELRFIRHLNEKGLNPFKTESTKSGLRAGAGT